MYSVLHAGRCRILSNFTRDGSDADDVHREKFCRTACRVHSEACLAVVARAANRASWPEKARLVPVDECCRRECSAPLPPRSACGAALDQVGREMIRFVGSVVSLIILREGVACALHPYPFGSRFFYIGSPNTHTLSMGAMYLPWPNL